MTDVLIRQVARHPVDRPLKRKRDLNALPEVSLFENFQLCIGHAYRCTFENLCCPDNICIITISSVIFPILASLALYDEKIIAEITSDNEIYDHLFECHIGKLITVSLIN